MDPITKNYPWYTPYQFAGNTPIQAIDLDGGEPKTVITEKSRSNQILTNNGSPDDPPSAPISVTLTTVTYKYTEAAVKLLSLVSGIQPSEIRKVEIQNAGGSGWPMYSPSEGGGALTFPGDEGKYRMNFTNNFFDGRFGKESHDRDGYSWVKLSSHVVGHIRDINEIGGGTVKYIATFVKEYVTNLGHDGSPRERRAQKGAVNFMRFSAFVTKYYGKNKLSDLLNNVNNTDKQLSDRIGQWWSRYKKEEAEQKRLEGKKP